MLIILLFENLCASDLSCLGGTQPTPIADRLAARSVLFTACFATCEVTPDNLVGPQFQIVDMELSHVVHGDCELVHSLSTDTLLHITRIDDITQLESGLSAILAAIQRDCPQATLVLTALWGHRDSSAPQDIRSVIGERAAHVPLMIARPSQQTPRRHTSLLTTQELPSLLEQLKHSTGDQPPVWLAKERGEREQVSYRSETAVAVRTRHWLLLDESPLRIDTGESPVASRPSPTEQPQLIAASHPDVEDRRPLLFHKPEDIWEVLDVAEQYPQVIAHYQSTGQLLPASELLP